MLNAHTEIQWTLKKLKRSNLYYNNIFHSIPLAVVITDQNGCITAVNPAAEKMWDLLPADCLGSPISEIAFFSSFLREKSTITLLTRNRNEINEWSFTHSSGEKRFSSLDFVPLFDDQQEITGVIIIGTDITLKKRLEKEKKILEGLLPICSYCKKIRDQSREWIMLEQYIGDHSCARFSHSICPDCQKEHYSGI